MNPEVPPEANSLHYYVPAKPTRRPFIITIVTIIGVFALAFAVIVIGLLPWRHFYQPISYVQYRGNI